MRKIKYPNNELQTLRASTNMSQETLASLLGCTRSMISKVENGKCELNIKYWKNLNILKNHAPGGPLFIEDPSALPPFTNYDIPENIKATEENIKAMQMKYDHLMDLLPLKTKCLYFYINLKGKIDTPVEYINLPERLAYVEVNTLIKDIQNLEIEIQVLTYKLHRLKNVLNRNKEDFIDPASK